MLPQPAATALAVPTILALNMTEHQNWQGTKVAREKPMILRGPAKGGEGGEGGEGGSVVVMTGPGQGRAALSSRAGSRAAWRVPCGAARPSQGGGRGQGALLLTCGRR